MTTYYAIKSDLWYIKGISVTGALSIGGVDVVKNMSDDETYIRELYEFIIENTTHDVCIQKINLEFVDVI